MVIVIGGGVVGGAAAYRLARAGASVTLVDPAATGHGPSGLQLGPYSGPAVADMAMGKAPDIDLGAYAAGRAAGR